jgi:DNA-binding MarR family transcriptional regulator
LTYPALDGLKKLINPGIQQMRSKKIYRLFRNTRRYLGRPELAEIFREGNKRDRKIRNKEIYRAHMKFGYTLKEITDYLDIHYTTVSKTIKEMKGRNLYFKT